MRIIIVGCGKVGTTIARHLSQEGNDITIIDRNPEVFDKVLETLDVMVVKGNGLSARTLSEAEVSGVDLVISVTSSDETNILCCLTAKKLGAEHTIARVRDPEYAVDLYRFRQDLGLDLIINPEQQSALEISRLLRFPNADNIETFVNGRVELISFIVRDTSPLKDHSVMQVFPRDKVHVIAALVERDNQVFIPHGNFVFAEGDRVRLIGSPNYVSGFFSYFGRRRSRVEEVTIIGGGIIAQYLIRELIKDKIQIKVVEIDYNRCTELSEAFPTCTIIHGDGADEDLLDAENIAETGAVVCLTSRDEENAVIALYAMSVGVPKSIVKITHINSNLVHKLGLTSVITPQTITAY